MLWRIGGLTRVWSASKTDQILGIAAGVLLVVLMLVGLPLKYIWGDGRVVTWTGVPHGWLYMVLLITAYDLGRRVRWPWLRLGLIALAVSLTIGLVAGVYPASRAAKMAPIDALRSE